jgi:hypothetical protein
MLSGVGVTDMNEKFKKTRLNDAFKRFQRLPILLPKSDTRDESAEKTAWQPTSVGSMGKYFTNPTPALQVFAE